MLGSFFVFMPARSALTRVHQAYTNAAVRGQTLYYMPHCEQFLYDGVLAACVRLRALHRVALLGNSFAEYAEREDLRPADQRKRDASALLQLQPFVTGACLHTAGRAFLGTLTAL